MFLHGEFSLISPASLLQLLGQERRTARVRAWRGASAAQVDLLEGMLVAASCDDLRGEEAVFRLLVWECGRFQVEQLIAAPEEVEMAAPWEELLLEAARRRDELELQAAALPEQPGQAQLDDLLGACPALRGVALVGQDGRLLGAVGLEPRLAEQVSVVVSSLAAALEALALRRGFALLACGGYRLLLVSHGDQLLLGIAAPGANIGDATSQLAALGAPAPAL